MDNNTQIVSVAIVDHYGELVAHKDFMHLLPPRKFPERFASTEEEREKLKKLKLSH
jgi:predicted amidohydrolase